MAISQTRSTGGFIFHALNGQLQCHIDPGPGAVRDLRDYQINPQLTNYLILTHPHTDHNMSMPIIIEGMQKKMSFESPFGTLIAPAEYINGTYLDPYYFKLLSRLIGTTEGTPINIEPGFRVKGTPTVHCRLPNQGYLCEIGTEGEDYFYRIAFTSDTAFFPEYVSTYSGVDILVANLLRPNNVKCPGHLTTDEFIPLIQQIKPKLCILVHFGAQMHEKVTEQVEKIQSAVGEDTCIIGSSDGLRIPFAEVLMQ